MTDIHKAIQKAADEIMAETLAQKDAEITRLRHQRDELRARMQKINNLSGASTILAKAEL